MKNQQEMTSHLRLMLSTQHPDFESCWLDGYECAQKDLDEANNPFDEHTAEYNHWSDGWWAGFYGESQKAYSAAIAKPASLDYVEITSKGVSNKAANEKHASFFSNVGRFVIAFLGTVVIYEILDIAA